MRSTALSILQVLHQWAALAYLAGRVAFAHGWFEVFEYSPADQENAVCPVKQLIGISVHELPQ